MRREQIVRLDSAKIGNDGLLRVRARIARIGIMDYYEDGRLYRELRTVDTVKESAIGFSQCGIILDHVAMLDKLNKDSILKGLSGTVTYEDGWLVTDLTVFKSDAIVAAETTHRQISCGYDANVIDSPGVWVDEVGVMGVVGKEYHYDRIQENIEANHIALVRQARAGEKATFLDSAHSELIIDCCIKDKNTNNKNDMEEIKFKYNGKTYSLGGKDAEKVMDMLSNQEKKEAEKDDSFKKKEQEHNDAIDTVTAKLDASAAKLDALEMENTTLKTENEALKTQLDSVDVSSEISERLAIWDIAKSHIKVDSVDYSLDTNAIQKLVLAEVYPNLAVKLDSESYVSTLWDIFVESKPVSKQDAVKIDVQNTVTKKTDNASAYQAARNNYFTNRFK